MSHKHRPCDTCGKHDGPGHQWKYHDAVQVEDTNGTIHLVQYNSEHLRCPFCTKLLKNRTTFKSHLDTRHSLLVKSLTSLVNDGAPGTARRKRQSTETPELSGPDPKRARLNSTTAACNSSSQHLNFTKNLTAPSQLLHRLQRWIHILYLSPVKFVVRLLV